jgi:hypothetical protein
MALLTTCSAANRIIDQALSTEWTRTLVTSLDNAVEGFYGNVNYSFANTQAPVKIFVKDRPYWRYDIKRTMAYHYFGLYEQAAVDFATQVTAKLNAPIFPLAFMWDGGTTGASSDGYWRSWFSTDADAPASPKPAYGRPNSRGTAVASPDHDDAWKVDISISESWTVPWRPSGTATGSYLDDCWTLFEERPNDRDNYWNYGTWWSDPGSFFRGVYGGAGDESPAYLYDSDNILTAN